MISLTFGVSEEKKTNSLINTDNKCGYREKGKEKWIKQMREIKRYNFLVIK